MPKPLLTSRSASVLIVLAASFAAYANSIGNEKKALAVMEEYILRHPGDAEAVTVLIMLGVESG